MRESYRFSNIEYNNGQSEKDDKMRAIGSLNNLPDHIRQAFEPGNDFNQMPAPGPYDWLAHHKELGQTYDGYIHSIPVKPDELRKIIYLQPVSGSGYIYPGQKTYKNNKYSKTHCNQQPYPRFVAQLH